MADIKLELSILRQLVDDDMRAVQRNVKELTATADAHLKFDGYDNVHLVTVGPPAAPVRWKTKCGKRFAATAYSIVSTHDGNTCDRCLRV